MIRAIRVIVAAILMVASVATFIQPELIEDVMDVNVVINSDDDNDELLGIQSDEHWLVLIVEFDGLPSGAGKDAERAEALLMGVNGADDYLEQATASHTSLQITVFDNVYSAQSSPSAWGTDSDGNRDVASDGSRPSDLAELVIRNIPDHADLSDFDLDNNGVVDRLLILHTGSAQESSGTSSDIWSHFQYLPDVITIGNSSIGHYTMASFQSGLGTIIHEMLHQMGGLDLYDVHDESDSDEWNGVGDFDIMASGNWNGNGRTPSLPMSATMNLIGFNRSIDAELLGTNVHVNLTPMSAGGTSLSFSISPTETLYMEYRGDIGFDRHIPGHGLLVSIVDEYDKTLNRNEVNINPDSPYLRVIEADANSGLYTGADSGTASDLFVEDAIIGSDEYLIFDAHGRLVNWNATIISMNPNSIHIHLQWNNSHFSDVLPERSTVELLTNESIQIIFDVDAECIPWTTLISSDDRNSKINISSPINGTNILIDLNWIQPSIVGSHGTLDGKIGCGIHTIRLVIIKWSIVPHKILESNYDGIIPYDESTLVSIPIDLVGNGSRTYTVSIEGALDRICETDESVILNDNGAINLSIDPNGLLTPNMFAEGTIVLTSNDDIRTEIQVKLFTENIQSGPFGDYITPATLASILIFLLGITVLPPFSRKPTISTDDYLYSPEDYLYDNFEIDIKHNSINTFQDSPIDDPHQDV